MSRRKARTVGPVRGLDAVLWEEQLDCSAVVDVASFLPRAPWRQCIHRLWLQQLSSNPPPPFLGAALGRGLHLFEPQLQHVTHVEDLKLVTQFMMAKVGLLPAAGGVPCTLGAQDKGPHEVVMRFSPLSDQGHRCQPPAL